MFLVIQLSDAEFKVPTRYEALSDQIQSFLPRPKYLLVRMGIWNRKTFPWTLFRQLLPWLQGHRHNPIIATSDQLPVLAFLFQTLLGPVALELARGHQLPSWLEDLLARGPSCNLEEIMGRKGDHLQNCSIYQWMTCCHTSKDVLKKELAGPLTPIRLLNRSPSPEDRLRALDTIREIFNRTDQWILFIDIESTDMAAHSFTLIRDLDRVYHVHSYVERFQLRGSVMSLAQAKGLLTDLTTGDHAAWAASTQTTDHEVPDLIDLEVSTWHPYVKS